MLAQGIKNDLKSALKAGRGDEVRVLRLIIAAIINQEKEKRYQLCQSGKGLGKDELDEQSRLSDKEIIKLLFSQVKQRKDVIQDFNRGGRKDLVEKEEAEIRILSKYLPEQLSSAEIEKQAQQVINDIGARDIKEMGKVMGILMAKLGNRAGGGDAGRIVKNLLAGS